MADLLQRGLAWLDDQRHAHMTQTVLYVRDTENASYIGELLATLPTVHTSTFRWGVTTPPGQGGLLPEAKLVPRRSHPAWEVLIVAVRTRFVLPPGLVSGVYERATRVASSVRTWSSVGLSSSPGSSTFAVPWSSDPVPVAMMATLALTDTAEAAGTQATALLRAPYILGRA